MLEKKIAVKMKSLKIGLAGFGTVGGGTYAVLKRNRDLIARRSGMQIDVKTVVCRSLERARAAVDAATIVSTDWHDIVNDPEIAIVVEAMGGTTAARDFINAAIAAGKHVVTANKALLALHGNEIFDAAAKKGVIVAFEAAVAGGVPIIKALREGLAANRIQWVVGIINGTSNYILTQMREKGWSFEKALKEAQALGYAEADPTFDVEGVDAAHKLCILSSIAFGVPIDFSAAYVEGISKLHGEDIAYAEEFGYRVKLFGITRRTEKGVQLRVHPSLVPHSRLIANVEGVLNAVVVQGDAVGSTLYYGRGAGAEPTASAVIADLIDCTRLIGAGAEHQVPFLGYRAGGTVLPYLPMSETVCPYYLRLQVQDEPGVLADVCRIFASHRISIQTMVQKGAHGKGLADIVFLTHQAREGATQEAIAEIEQLSFVKAPVVMLRIEDLN